METVSVPEVVTAVGASEMPPLENVGASDAVAATGMSRGDVRPTPAGGPPSAHGEDPIGGGMPRELDALLEGLSDAERSTLTAACTADCELARGLATMVDGLPHCVTELLMRRLSVHLGRRGLGEGAFLAALTDVVYQRLEHENERH